MSNETHSGSASGANPPDDLAHQLASARLQLSEAQQQVARLQGELTVKRHAEEALWINTSKLRMVLKQLPILIWTADRQGRITSWAGSGPVSKQLEQSQLVGLTLQALLETTDETSAPLAAAERANRGESSQQTFHWKGRRFSFGMEPSWNRQGEVTGHVAVALDLTDSADPSALGAPLGNLAEADRTRDAVSRLAAGIAHEFNNVLTGIVGYTDLWLLQISEGDPMHEVVATIQEGALRATRLTRQLLAYGRRGKNQNVAIDLAGLLREELTQWPGDRYSVEIQLEHPVTIVGDPEQWREVFRSLLQNAREAMPGGGTLSITSELISLRHPLRIQDAEFPPGRYTRLTIRDTGEGIRRENLSRVFDPFFSTRKSDQNLGMGLALAYGIVRNHQGALTIESQPGAGTSVHLYFPAPSAPPALAGPAAARIVVIDDEPYVRHALEQMLIGLGHHVTAFPDCQTAIPYYRQHNSDVDLVILDLVMPERSGTSCYTSLRAINPAIKAILASGFGQDGAVQEALDLGFNGFLQKPFQLATLRETVGKALDPGQRPQ